jgi:hypothetical protein
MTETTAVERADRRYQSKNEKPKRAGRIKNYWGIGSSFTEAASGFGMTSTAAFSVSNHRLP